MVEWNNFANVFVPGIYAIPGGKRGNNSFEINYPKLPQGHYVVYTGLGRLVDESQGARYIDHGDLETYIIYDVYMKTGIVYTEDTNCYDEFDIFYEI